jgi:hypothetical protein
MIAIAVVAVLIPFPLEACWRLLLVGVGLIGLILFATTMERLLKRVSVRVTPIAVPGLVGVLVWKVVPHFEWEQLAGGVIYDVLLVLGCAGLLVVFRRFRARLYLTSGHLLWAWSGLILTASHCPLGVTIDFPDRSELVDITEFCRLTLAFFLIVVSRHSDKVHIDQNTKYLDRVGCIVMESVILLWGWYALHFLI